MGYALNRNAFYNYISRRAQRNGLVAINEVELARELQCCRDSVRNMVGDLEAAGQLRRFKRRGPRGLLVQLLVPPYSSSHTLGRKGAAE